MAENVVELRNARPFDLAQQTIDDLYDEAKTWLDGTPVKTQEQADTVAKLLDLTRKAKKDANAARVDEKKPHDDAAKAVQERYKPILSKADLIADTCKKVVAPYLAEQERQKREAERAAREQAEAAERAAQAALQQSGIGDIEERAAAEKLVESAKSAQANADKLARDKGHAKGGDRAMSLRTTYSAELTDLSAAIRHYWSLNAAPFQNLVCELAAKDVRTGKREIPGFKVNEEKVAV